MQAIDTEGKTVTLSDRSEPEGHFTDGVLTIAGESRMVAASDGPTVTVDYPFTASVIGEPYTLRRGCNKTYDESCVGRFQNGHRFGGFVSVPLERLTRPLRRTLASLTGTTDAAQTV